MAGASYGSAPVLTSAASSNAAETAKPASVNALEGSDEYLAIVLQLLHLAVRGTYVKALWDHTG
eukprot:3826020-Rhodomonas_salina.2